MRTSLLNLAVALVLVGTGAAFADDDEEGIAISGKVIGPHGSPVAGVRLLLRDKETGRTVSASSNSQGKFTLVHPRAPLELLEVFPPAKLGFAQVSMDNISGEETKHFIVQLRRGFNVSGFVSAAGKGLKGIDVRAIPHGKMHQGDTAHGGGHSVTAGNGKFVLILTPGERIIELTNNRYPALVGLHTEKISVIGDTDALNLTLPAKGK